MVHLDVKKAVKKDVCIDELEPGVLATVLEGNYATNIVIAVGDCIVDLSAMKMFGGDVGTMVRPLVPGTRVTLVQE